MNQKVGITIGVVLLLLVLLGGGLFFLMKKNQTPSSVITPVQQEAKPIEPQTLQGTLKDLFTSGKSVKCSFDNNSTDSAKVTGIVYVSGGKVRGDFSPASHMVVDGQTSYLWTDMSKQGMKFAMTTSDKTQGPDLNQQVGYSCQDWNSDATMFTLPADITFSAINIPRQ